jgi:Tol biopolymer transport system component
MNNVRIQEILAGLLIAGGCLAQVTLRAFLSDLPGDVYDAALSPDGDRVALSWCNGVAPNYQCGVYLRPTSGGEPKLLFHEKELAQQLRWSPDGRWLAYTDISSHNSTLLWVVPIEGGEATKIAQICWGGYTWTGKSLGFIASAAKQPTQSSEDCNLITFSRDGKKIGTIAAKGYHPAVSPDGRTLAYERNNSLIVRSLSDPFHAMAPERKVATEDSYFAGPVWTSGGKQLLYATRGLNPLHRVSLIAGAKPEVVPGIDDQSEIVSLDQNSSGSIVAEIWRHDAAFWRMDLRAPQPHFEKIQAIPHTRARYCVSPDGRRVAFISDGGLFTSDLDGLNTKLTTTHQEVILNPRWSPDGTWIAFTGLPSQGNADLRSRLYMVAAEGGRPRRLLPGSDNISFQSWSRDGKWLYVSHESIDLRSDAKPQLWKMNLANGSQVQITSTGGWFGEESADGEFLYYVQSPYPKLRRVGTSGGPESPMLSTTFGGLGTFAVGKESVYFVPDGRNYGSKQVSRFDIATGKVLVVAGTDFVPFYLQLSSDERYLYATSRPSETKAHVILEGLP